MLLHSAFDAMRGTAGRIKRTPANYLSISLDIYHCFIVGCSVSARSWYRQCTTSCLFLSFCLTHSTLSSFCFKRAVCVRLPNMWLIICFYFVKKLEKKKDRISRLPELVDSMEVDYEKTTKLSIDRGNRKQCWSLSHCRNLFQVLFCTCVPVNLLRRLWNIHRQTSETSRSKVHRIAIHVHTHTHSQQPRLVPYVVALKQLRGRDRTVQIECTTSTLNAFLFNNIK